MCEIVYYKTTQFNTHWREALPMPGVRKTFPKETTFKRTYDSTHENLILLIPYKWQPLWSADNHFNPFLHTRAFGRL